MNMELSQLLTNAVGKDAIFFDEPMARHTTFRVGGPADVFIVPKDERALCLAIQICKENAVPFMIIGNGSNLLVGDQGIRGVVFQIFHTFDHIEFSPAQNGAEYIRAGAGISMSKVSRAIAQHSLKGFEFASGIPGTLGGGVAMNAGAYGGEIKDCIVSAKVLTLDGQILELTKDEMELTYRNSIILKNGYIVLEAMLKLEKGDQKEITDRIEELSKQRREKQPLEYPSAGSTFKRPEGYFAGKLIQDAGLKGYSVGDACVSEKHSGFVINKGHASAKDILTLIHDVQEKVFNEFGVKLEPEVRIIGEF